MNDDIVISIIKRAIVVSLFVIGASFFLFEKPLAIINGYIFGSIISILNFKLLHNIINKLVFMPPNKASRYYARGYIAKYFIYFIVLLIAAYASYLNFVSAIIGLFLIKYVILFSVIMDKNFK